MFQLYWTPLAINLFVGVLVALILAAYFLFQMVGDLINGREWRLSGLLLMTMAATSIAGTFQFGSYVVHPDYVNYLLPWVSVFGSTATGFYALFALQLQRPQNGWRAFVLMATAVFVAMILIEVFVAVQRAVLLEQGMVEFREAWLDIPVSSAFFLAQMGFLFHLVRAFSEERGISLLKAVGPAIGSVFTPNTPLSKRAGVARAFFYSALMPVSFGLVAVLRSYGVIDWRAAELGLSWLLLLTFAGLALSYLNYIPERSTFQVKLVGATLITVFAILSGVAWLIGPVYVDAYENDKQLQDPAALRFEPDRDGSYLVANTSYRLETDYGVRIENTDEPVNLPFDFPFYGDTYDALFTRHAGIVGFDQLPLWRDIQHRFGPQPTIFLVAAELVETGHPNSGLFVNAAPDRVTLSWRDFVSPFAADEKYSFQMRLYPTGVIEMVFAELPERATPDLFRASLAPMMTGIVPGLDGREVRSVDFTRDLPLALPPGYGAMANYRLDFMTYLNRIYQPTAIYIFASALIALLVFPLFFQINLNRPLQSMLRGVRGLRKGDLATQIPVSYPDEIGFLAASFNEMADAQRNLVQTLEDKVAARTAEAVEFATSNARLEERNHLTRELHDTVSQTLFSANLIADKLPDLWRKDPDDGAEVLQEMRQLNREALSEMRQLLLFARPDLETGQNFGQLLNALVQRFEPSLKIDLQIEADACMPPDTQLAFYRIAQEALNNIVKHAGSDSASIQFDGLEGQAMLTISDQGTGFGQSSAKPDSLGLRFMRERMEDIGGSLEIDTISGQGTTITAIWFADAAK